MTECGGYSLPVADHYTTDKRFGYRTYTDGDALQIVRAGVPTALISVPLKYMHTSVELLDTNVIRESGRLLAHFLSELDEGWDRDLWI